MICDREYVETVATWLRDAFLLSFATTAAFALHFFLTQYVLLLV